MEPASSTTDAAHDDSTQDTSNQHASSPTTELEPANQATAAPEAPDAPDAPDAHESDTDAAEQDNSQWTVVPEDAVSISKDDAVKKVVVTEGTGDTPTLHARCLVHYVGRLLSTGEVFMDTAKEFASGQPAQLIAGRECASREGGLNLAVATMKVGEVARVYVLDPKYGYGERGSFSFPCVPPSALLMFQMELLSWEAVEEGEGSMRTYEDKLDAAERRRLAGNALFREGKHKEALNKYVMALSFLDEDFLMQLEGRYLDQAEAVKAPLHLNMAACQLQMGDPTTAVYNCGQVLQLQPKNVKALYRRGVARHQLGQTDAALQDLEAALKLDPSDLGIQKEMRAVKGSIKEERKAEAQMFRGRLGPAPSPAATVAAEQAPSGGAVSRAKDAPGGSPARGVMGPLAQLLGFGYAAVCGLFVWLFQLRR